MPRTVQIPFLKRASLSRGIEKSIGFFPFDHRRAYIVPRMDTSALALYNQLLRLCFLACERNFLINIISQPESGCLEYISRRVCAYNTRPGVKIVPRGVQSDKNDTAIGGIKNYEDRTIIFPFDRNIIICIYMMAEGFHA